MSRPVKSRTHSKNRVMVATPPEEVPPQTAMAQAGLQKTYDYNTTALLVRFLRRTLLGCTLDEYSELSGVNADLISRYEGGKVGRPTDRNLDRLLSAAGVLDLKLPLLRAFQHLSGLLMRVPSTSTGFEEFILEDGERDPFLAFAVELVRRTTQRLGASPVGFRQE